MRKKINLMVLMILVLFVGISSVAFSGCKEEKPIASQIVVEKNYQEAYTYLAPSTIIINGEPIIITTPHRIPESFHLKLFVTYIDETTEYKTIQVTKAQYEKAVIGEEWKG